MIVAHWPALTPLPAGSPHGPHGLLEPLAAGGLGVEELTQEQRIQRRTNVVNVYGERWWFLGSTFGGSQGIPWLVMVKNGESYLMIVIFCG